MTRLILFFVLLVDFTFPFPSFLPFFGSGPGGNRRGRRPVEYRRNLYVPPSLSSVRLSVCPPVHLPVRPSSPPKKLAQASQMLARAYQR